VRQPNSLVQVTHGCISFSASQRSNAPACATRREMMIITIFQKLRLTLAREVVRTLRAALPPTCNLLQTAPHLSLATAVIAATGLEAALRTGLSGAAAIAWAQQGPFPHPLNFFGPVIAIVVTLDTAGGTMEAHLGCLHGALSGALAALFVKVGMML
jgi:hypothetical protein